MKFVDMKRTTKETKIKKELKKIYKDLAEERPHYCSGCGRSDVPLSHSHINAVRLSQKSGICSDC